MLDTEIEHALVVAAGEGPTREPENDEMAVRSTAAREKGRPKDFVKEVQTA